MTPPKHTPGPWFVDGPADNQIVWSDSDNRICFLAHSNGASDAQDFTNGRLIAAAPDLAELVGELLTLHEAHHNNPVHAKARAILARVRGEHQ